MLNNTWPSPAKINLFLHIVAQRADGYHELQTVFQIVNFCDQLSFELMNNGNIICDTRDSSLTGPDNLCVQAAEKLRQAAGIRQGVRIKLTKRIPVGAGLGGGSSNAATTLLALNKLWNLNLSRSELLVLASDLGADVPVFVNGYSVWAEGTGEKFKNLSLPESWYLIVYPRVSVSTRKIFSSPRLTRAQMPITIADFLAGRCKNVMTPVVFAEYPEVKSAYLWLDQYGTVKMSGSGSCLFMEFDSQISAQQMAMKLPKKWSGFVVKGLVKSPLLAKLN